MTDTNTEKIINRISQNIAIGAKSKIDAVLIMHQKQLRNTHKPLKTLKKIPTTHNKNQRRNNQQKNKSYDNANRSRRHSNQKKDDQNGIGIEYPIIL